MDQTNIEALANEVAQLRRSNRAVKRVGGVCAALAAAVLLTGQGKKEAKTIESDNFVGTGFYVKGKGDKYRAALEVDDKGTFPTLSLSDSKERVRLTIGLDKTGEPLITFFDKEGKASKQISADSK